MVGCLKRYLHRATRRRGIGGHRFRSIQVTLVQTFQCVCKKIKGEANHWMIVRRQAISVDGWTYFAFMVFEWDDRLAGLPESVHVCGSSCLQKLLGETTDQWI